MTSVTYGTSLIEVPDQTVLLIDICEAFFDKAIADRLLRRGQAALRSDSTQQIVVTLPYEPLPSMADTYELIVDWTGLEDLLAAEDGEEVGATAGTSFTTDLGKSSNIQQSVEEPLLLALNQLGVAELLAEQSEDTAYAHPKGLPPCPTPLDHFGLHMYPFSVYNPFTSLRNMPGEGTSSKGQRYSAAALSAALADNNSSDSYYPFNDTIAARWHSDGHANRSYAAHHQDYIGPNLSRHAQVHAACIGGPSMPCPPYVDDLDFADVDTTTTVGGILNTNQDGQPMGRLGAFMAAVAGAAPGTADSALVSSVVFQKSGIYNKVAK